MGRRNAFRLSLPEAERETALGALETAFSSGASWNRPEGGYFLWLELDGVDTSALSVRAENEAHVAFVPGAGFFLPGSGQGATSARLAFSYEPPDRIAEGIGRLAALLG